MTFQSDNIEAIYKPNRLIPMYERHAIIPMSELNPQKCKCAAPHALGRNPAGTAICNVCYGEII